MVQTGTSPGFESKSDKLCSLGLCLHHVVFVHDTDFHLLHCDTDFGLSTAQQHTLAVVCGVLP